MGVEVGDVIAASFGAVFILSLGQEFVIMIGTKAG